jgi:hypothetical protein
MTYLVLQSTRRIGAVAVNASLRVNLLASCSGAIEQILDSGATHRFEKAAYSSLQKIYSSIIPQSPVTTQDNRGLVAGSFGTIGGIV